MAEYIECLRCDATNCEGCNVYTLSKMLHAGKFDCLMDEHRSIVAPLAKIVRCKDCKYRELTGKAPFMYYRCAHNDGLVDAVRENDFCSYGERRANDG